MVLRLWPTFFAAISLAITGFGCTGQNVEGAWHGDLPLDQAEDCTIKLDSHSRFDVGCKEYAVVAVGTYRWNGASITFHFVRYANGKEVKRPPSDLTMNVIGHGNSLDLSYYNKSYRWQRRAR